MLSRWSNRMGLTNLSLKTTGLLDIDMGYKMELKIYREKKQSCKVEACLLVYNTI